MGQYFLGIDNGNTVSKAALFDAHGKEISLASDKVETVYPHPGWTERDMASLWKSTACAIREVLHKSGVRPEEIAAIGNTGHGNGLYLLDKKGQPLRNGIQSMDTRAGDITVAWQESRAWAKFFPYTIQSLWPAQPNALLAWIKQHEPQNYERIGAVLMCKDYIKYCLTGEITSDYTDMSGTSLLDVRRRCYSRDLMELYNLEEVYEALPPLSQSFEVIGQVTRATAEETGLRVGTPVVGGVFDVDGSAIGCGAVRAGQSCIVAGTWSINEVITQQPIVDPNIFMTTLFAEPGSFLSVEASATSATNLEWFVAQCCGDERAEAKQRGVSVYAVCDEVVAGLEPGSTNLIFHPFLYGSNVQPTARAGFYGVAGWHTRAHLLRALYEGVVFSHLSHINKLRAAGAEIKAVRLTGGGSRSRVWSQMFADALQVSVEISDGTELGARGAALSAGIGAGAYGNYAEAVEQAVSITRVQEPVPANSSLYLARYSEYQRLTQAMQTPWDALNKLT